MLETVLLCFSWLPNPLALLVAAVIFIFSVIVAFQAVKLVFDICSLLAQAFGGIFSKIVSFFT